MVSGVVNDKNGPLTALGPVPPAGRTPAFVYVLCSMAVIGGFLFGYDTGVVAGAVVVIKENWQSRGYELDHTWQQLIVSMTVAAAAVFAFLGGFLNDWLGRKVVTLIASALFFAGSVWMAFTPVNAKWWLLLGRIVVGAAIGMSSMTVPAYVAESSPVHIRGRMITLFQVMITFGFFVAGVLGAVFYIYLPQSSSWRWMLGVAAAPAAIQMIGFIFLPESPRWLAMHNKDDLALKALKKLNSNEATADYELKAIQISYQMSQREIEARGGGVAMVIMLRTAALRRALLVGCLLMMFQQLCGINTVMYYSTSIIEMGGIHDTSTALWFSTITSGVNFLMTFAGLYLVERLGRRKLTLLSVFGVCLCLVLLGVCFLIIHKQSPIVQLDRTTTLPNDTCSQIDSCNKCSYQEQCGFCFHPSNPSQTGHCRLLNQTNSNFASDEQSSCSWKGNSTTVANGYLLAREWCPNRVLWFPVVAMVLYLCCFSVGFGPMPWTINAEIYPHWARSSGNSIATATNWAFNLLISETFLYLATAISREGAYFLYAAITFVGLLTFFLLVPETKNKSLEQLESLFERPLSQLRPWRTATSSVYAKHSNVADQNGHAWPMKESSDVFLTKFQTTKADLDPQRHASRA